MSSPRFPEPPPSVPATSLPTVDALVAGLVARKDHWVQVGLPRRVELLRACIDATVAAAEGWVLASCKAKGIDPGSSLAGQEWLGGPMAVVRNMRLLVEALEQGGKPKLPGVHTRPDGQVVADVFPDTLLDKLLYTGYRAEVWIEPGESASQGQIYRDKAAGKVAPGKVALVLGAGNVSSIGAMDALYKLFAEDEVAIIKTNPVNAYIGASYEAALKPLVDEGVLAVVHGGAEVGQHLTAHPDISSVHITGSDRTHDAIVWGADPDEQARRKAANDPKLNKPISSELGCVTPVLVVPGDWSESDLDYHALQVASMVENNGSFNCNAAKALVLARGWPQRQRFVEKVRAALASIPTRKAYYPGALDRYQAFVSRYPNAVKLVEGAENVVPWTVLPDVPPQAGEYALTQEAFCGVLAEVSLDATEPADFLKKATDFANDVMWGSLSCCLLIHPATAAANAAALDAAIAGLRYGGIAVNAWAAVLYALSVTTWGAYPGHPLTDIRSGRGVVHNTYLLDHPQKSVVYAPFRIKPTPPWFSNHRNLRQLGERLTKLEAAPSLLGVPAVALAAMRG